MISLRPYQQDAVGALFDYFGCESGNPLVVVPTGGGKTLIIAEFIRRTIEQWPAERFLVLSHVKELLEQNATKLQAMAPHLHVGLYSAGLGSREIGQHVTVAGIQSVYRRAHKMGDVSIVIVDEAHLVSKGSESMYRKFLDALCSICPHLRVVGLSATPFRLDSGALHKGSKRLFTDIAYRVDMLDLIRDGYLAPLVTAPTKFRIDTSGVAKRGGEYIADALAACVDRDENTELALDQAIPLCADRKSWLVFCVSVDHATHVTEALRKRGVAAEIVVGETPKAERAARLDAFKRGELRALVSVGVLTTGFDAPNADALICLRPTMSPGLWIQMVGRVSRPSPTTDKANGLVLDFTGNTRAHGPVDSIEITTGGDADSGRTEGAKMFCPTCDDDTMVRKGRCVECGYVHVKTCPECGQGSIVIAPECLSCGFVWPVNKLDPPELNAAPTSAPILSNDASKVVTDEVTGWEIARHRKEGKPDSVRVTYVAGLVHLPYREWVCFDHGGYAADKARLWWLMHGGRMPVPASVTEALERKAELRPPQKVRAMRDGKYWKIVS